VTGFATERAAAFEFAGFSIPPGRRRIVDLPLMRLPTGTPLSLPVAIVHGRAQGPAVWLSGAIHGDEVNGVEITRQVAATLDPRSLRGTVVAVPTVNVLGFLAESRYLPDRRDLNRAFPGSPRGSLAARLAHLFTTTIVQRCVAGIDYHTGTDHRTNLPQIRGDLQDPEVRRLATAFAAPVMVQAAVRDGSLRQAATELGRTTLVYEGGQAHRFDAEPVGVGVGGTLRVLAALGMIRSAPAADRRPEEITRTTWIRARRSGITRVLAALGDRVSEGDVIAEIGAHQSTGPGRRHHHRPHPRSSGSSRRRHRQPGGLVTYPVVTIRSAASRGLHSSR
jgi:predicted deacylase